MVFLEFDNDLRDYARFLQLKSAHDVVKDVLSHMISTDNPSRIAVSKGWLCSIYYLVFYFYSAVC